MENSSGNNGWAATKQMFASSVRQMSNAFKGHEEKIRDRVSEMGKLMPDGMRNIGIRKSEQSKQGTNVADSSVNDADSVENIRDPLVESPSNMPANGISGGMVEIDLGCSDSFVLCDGLIGDAEEGQQSGIGEMASSSPNVKADAVSSGRKKCDYSAVYSYYDQKNASAVSRRKARAADAVQQRSTGMSGWLPDMVKGGMEAVGSSGEWLSSALKGYRETVRNKVPFEVRKLIPEEIRNTVDNIIKAGEQSRHEQYVQMFDILDSGANSYASPSAGDTSNYFAANLNDTSKVPPCGAVDTVSSKHISDYSAMYSHYAQKDDAVAVRDKVAHAAGKKSGCKSKAKRKLDYAHSSLIYKAIGVKTSLKKRAKARKSAVNRKKSFFSDAVLEIERKYLVHTGDSVGSNIIKDIGIDGKIINLTVDGGVKLKVEAMLESKFFKKNNISAVKFVLPEREVVIERISDGVLNYVVTKGSFTLMSKGKNVDARVVVYADPQGEGNIIRVSDVDQVGKDLGDRISKVLVGGVFLWILLRYGRWTRESSGMYVASTAGCVAPSSNLIDVSLPNVKQPSCVIKGGGESPSTCL